MADIALLQRFQELYSTGYVPSVGCWVQVDPVLSLTTNMNAFNALGDQQMELYLIDQAGNSVGAPLLYSIPSGTALRLDLETVIASGDLPFEGSMWAWCKGATSEGSIGLQAIDLDFIDRTRPTGHALGSVHFMFDFLDTLGIAPYLDLVSPRLLVADTPEGGQRYQNFLGMASVPTGAPSGLSSNIALTVTNEAGETVSANQIIPLELLGSWFGDLAVLFPDLPSFLNRTGEKRGYGVLNVRDADGASTGLTAMLKVVDTVHGSMLVNHLNDRSFARPAQKG